MTHPNHSTVPVAIRLHPQVLAHLKDLARRLSFEQQRDLTWADLVRDCIRTTYPLPNVENNNG